MYANAHKVAIEGVLALAIEGAPATIQLGEAAAANNRQWSARRGVFCAMRASARKTVRAKRTIGVATGIRQSGP